MIYLAQPYSHPDPEIQNQRYDIALLWCAFFRTKHPYSPIVHWHNVAQRHTLPTDADFWLEHNRHMIDLSKALYVLKITGWEESKGLAHEIIHTAKKGKPIYSVEGPSVSEIYLVTPPTLLDKMKHGNHNSEPKFELKAIEGDVGGTD